MSSMRNIVYFLIMASLFVLVGQFQSWNLALSILNLCIISSVMALGVNMQWGYAGLFNAGVMGFAALGGLAAIVVSMPPVPGIQAQIGFLQRQSDELANARDLLLPRLMDGRLEI